MRLIDADDFGNRMYHEVFEKYTDMQKWDSGCWMRYKLFENVLREQPTIDPAPHWIPVTERTPTEDGEYITTVEDGEGIFTTSLDWRQDWKEWGFLSYYGVSDDDEPAWRRVTNVLAWQPYPEPYKDGE